MLEIDILNDRGVAAWVDRDPPFGLFTTDTLLNVRTWNHWLEKHSGRGAPEVIGKNLLDLYPHFVTQKIDRYFAQALEGRNIVLSHAFHHHLFPIPLDDDGNEPDNMPQSAIVSPLIIDDQICGIIGYIEDVTERVRREKELMEQVAEGEKLIEELKTASAQIKILSGMLPICSNCKKVRDDEGYWEQIESYITKHSEAVFSHGICPECAKKLYPEFYKGDDDKISPLTSEDRGIE